MKQVMKIKIISFFLIALALISGCGQDEKLGLIPFLSGSGDGQNAVQSTASLKSIIIFRFESPSAAGVIDEQNKAISVTVPCGTDVSSLTAVFTLSPGASAGINGMLQESGITPNDFSQPVDYLITAPDSTTVIYTVTVTVDACGSDFITYQFIGDVISDVMIDAQWKTIVVTVPNGTDVTALIASFTLSPGASADVSGVPQVSGLTVNDFTEPVIYTITALDSTVLNYTVKVSVVSLSNLDVDTWATKLFINANDLVSVEWVGWLWSRTFIAIDSSGGIYRSTTGDSWAQVSALPAAGADVACNTIDGQCIAMAQNGATAISSNYGQTWEPGQTVPFNSMHSISWNGNYFIAVGDEGNIWFSPYGGSFQNAGTFTSANLYTIICFMNQTCITGGANGALGLSPSGVGWNPLQSNVNVNLYGIAAVPPDSIVSVGDAGTILFSNDGLLWTVQNLPVSTALRSVAGCPGIKKVFISVGDSGTILKSGDGQTWQTLSSGTLNNLNAVACSPNEAVAVGANGTVLVSN